MILGELSCRRCGFDLILGRKAGTRPERSNFTKVALLIGVVVVAVLFMRLLGVTGPGDRQTGGGHPCETLLRDLRPPLLELVASGAAVPDCRTGEPSPADCWGPLAGPWTDDLQSLGLHIALSPTDEGFDLNCRADLDDDGEAAMFRTTVEVPPLALSGEGVR
jgi:hypothetical protein